MTVHDLKTWPAYFEALADGRKTFEARRDDRGFEAGDVLRLREWDPVPRADVSTCPTGTSTAAGWAADPKPRGYTGRELRAKVTYVMRGPSRFGVEAGFVVMALHLLPDQEAA